MTSQASISSSPRERCSRQPSLCPTRYGSSDSCQGKHCWAFEALGCHQRDAAIMQRSCLSLSNTCPPRSLATQNMPVLCSRMLRTIHNIFLLYIYLPFCIYIYATYNLSSSYLSFGHLGANITEKISLAPSRCTNDIFLDSCSQRACDTPHSVGQRHEHINCDSVCFTPLYINSRVAFRMYFQSPLPPKQTKCKTVPLPASAEFSDRGLELTVQYM